MALIPSDAGLRIRPGNDSPLQPLARPQEIPADLPELRQGQRFMASIQEVLPDNTYRALVAGKSVTLSLPEAAKSGDTLELVVVERTPKSILAQLEPLRPGQRFTASIDEVLPDHSYRASVGGRSVTLALADPAQKGDILELVVVERTAKAIVAQSEPLRQGQAFSARILEVLPGNIYRAAVAGRELQLQLDEPAQAGQTLRLRVIERGPTAIVAERADLGEGDSGAYPYALLSRAARQIGALLPPQGEAPQAAALNRGQPLLTAAPTTVTELTTALSRAVGQSGLFYEAHQAQWIAGKRPLAALLAEPQGSHSEAALIARHSAEAEVQAEATGVAETPAAPGAPTAAAALSPSADVTNARAAVAASALPMHDGVPDDLRPLVQQQLDAVATQRLLWHGEVWPGQEMQWQIERRAPDERATQQEPDSWSSHLNLTTPGLGRIQAAINLAGGGVGIAIAVADAEVARRLNIATPALEQSLAAAGVRLLGIRIKHEAD